MNSAEMCEKVFIKQRVKYYKKYFLNKEIQTAIYDAFQENLKSLAGAYIKFLLLYDCLKIISKSEEFEQNYDKDTRLYIKTMVKGLKILYKGLEEILCPLTEGLLGE